MYMVHGNNNGGQPAPPVESIKLIGTFSYNSRHCLGQGSYGKVFEGRDTTNNSVVAIKQMDLRNFERDKYLKNQLVNEIDVLKTVNHTNIVRLIDVLQTANSLYIVTEYCKDGDLRDLIAKRRISEKEATTIFIQLVDGFTELNSKGIIHRDLKPANILQHNGVFKIADFGFAKFVNNFNTTLLKSFVGSPLYMAPQPLLKQVYTTKCDIWSLGVIFYEMVYGETPWKGIDERDLAKNIITKPLNLKDNLNSFSRELLKRTLVVEEAKRISWEELFALKDKISGGIELNSPLNSNGALGVPLAELNPAQRQNNSNNNTNNTNAQNLKKPPSSANPANNSNPSTNNRKAEIQKYVKFMKALRNDLNFKHYVTLELFNNARELKELLKIQGSGSLLIDKFLILSAQAVRSASKTLLQEMGEKENRKPDQGNSTQETKNLFKTLGREFNFYQKFYEDLLEEMQRSSVVEQLESSKEMSGLFLGDLCDRKRENVAGLMKKYGNELLKLFSAEVKSMSASTSEGSRGLLKALDYFADFMIVLGKNLSVDTNYESFHLDKSAQSNPREWADKLAGKLLYSVCKKD